MVIISIWYFHDVAVKNSSRTTAKTGFGQSSFMTYLLCTPSITINGEHLSATEITPITDTFDRCGVASSRDAELCPLLRAPTAEDGLVLSDSFIATRGTEHSLRGG